MSCPLLRLADAEGGLRDLEVVAAVDWGVHHGCAPTTDYEPKRGLSHYVGCGGRAIKSGIASWCSASLVPRLSLGLGVAGGHGRFAARQSRSKAAPTRQRITPATVPAHR